MRVEVVVFHGLLFCVGGHGETAEHRCLRGVRLAEGEAVVALREGDGWPWAVERSARALGEVVFGSVLVVVGRHRHPAQLLLLQEEIGFAHAGGEVAAECLVGLVGGVGRGALWGSGEAGIGALSRRRRQGLRWRLIDGDEHSRDTLEVVAAGRFRLVRSLDHFVDQLLVVP